MTRIVALVVVAIVAVVVVQAIVQADGVVVVTNPAGASTKTVVIGENAQPQGKLAPGASVNRAYVPAVPTPPGVIGQYSSLPCTYPNVERAGAWNVQYLVRELGERE